MTNKDTYPDRIEDLDPADEFFVDLCKLIEMHEDSEDERERYLYALKDFSDEWLDTLSVTGSTWRTIGDREKIITGAEVDVGTDLVEINFKLEER